MRARPAVGDDRSVDNRCTDVAGDADRAETDRPDRRANLDQDDRAFGEETEPLHVVLLTVHAIAVVGFARRRDVSLCRVHE